MMCNISLSHCINHIAWQLAITLEKWNGDEKFRATLFLHAIGKEIWGRCACRISVSSFRSDIQRTWPVNAVLLTYFMESCPCIWSLHVSNARQHASYMEGESIYENIISRTVETKHVHDVPGRSTVNILTGPSFVKNNELINLLPHAPYATWVRMKWNNILHATDQESLHVHDIHYSTSHFAQCSHVYRAVGIGVIIADISIYSTHSMHCFPETMFPGQRQLWN